MGLASSRLLPSKVAFLRDVRMKFLLRCLPCCIASWLNGSADGIYVSLQTLAGHAGWSSVRGASLGGAGARDLDFVSQRQRFSCLERGHLKHEYDQLSQFKCIQVLNGAASK